MIQVLFFFTQAFQFMVYLFNKCIVTHVHATEARKGHRMLWKSKFAISSNDLRMEAYVVQMT